MKYFFIVIMTVAFGFTALAQETKAISAKGTFSLAPYAAQNDIKITNVNGELAQYSVMGYGAQLELTPMPNLLKGFSIFADVEQGEGENVKVGAEKIEFSGFSYGFSQYLNSFMFVGGSYGLRTLKVSNAAIDSEFKTKAVGIGVGFDILTVGDALALTLQAWYQTGYSKRIDNVNADYNTGTDTTRYLLGIRWSPSVEMAN